MSRPQGLQTLDRALLPAQQCLQCIFLRKRFWSERLPASQQILLSRTFGSLCEGAVIAPQHLGWRCFSLVPCHSFSLSLAGDLSLSRPIDRSISFFSFFFFLLQMAENIAPHVMKRLLREISDILRSPPDGIAIAAPDNDFSSVVAVIAGPVGTPYENGEFHVKLRFDSEFPAAPPKGYFLTKIFHPNVSNKGEICVNVLKKDWQPDLGIRHVLVVIRCLIIEPNPESALNEEAGRLLLEDYQAFAKHARLMTGVHALKRSSGLTGSQTSTCSSSSSSSSSCSSQSTCVSQPLLEGSGSADAGSTSNMPCGTTLLDSNVQVQTTVPAPEKDAAALKKKKALKRL